MEDSFAQPVALARADGASGEVVLRRRRQPDGTTIEELLVNGTFAMDSAETASERELGRLATGARRVLIGGLGLGYTVAAVLDEAADHTRLDVVELEPALVGWARAGLTPTLQRVAADPKVSLHTADVVHVLSGRVPDVAGPWDAILLDVDNGPDFLIHAENDALYAEPALRQAYDRLAPGGLLAIWCQGPSPELLARLRLVGDGAAESIHHVRRGERDLAYAIYTLRRPVGGPEPAGARRPE